jgi:hypothetical protein
VRGAKRPQGEAGAHVGRARSARAKAGGRARACVGRCGCRVRRARASGEQGWRGLRRVSRMRAR